MRIIIVYNSDCECKTMKKVLTSVGLTAKGRNICFTKRAYLILDGLLRMSPYYLQ